MKDSSDHYADAFKNRIGSACWCVRDGVAYYCTAYGDVNHRSRKWLERYKQKLKMYKTTHLSLDTSSHPPGEDFKAKQ